MFFDKNRNQDEFDNYFNDDEEEEDTDFNYFAVAPNSTMKREVFETMQQIDFQLVEEEPEAYNELTIDEIDQETMSSNGNDCLYSKQLEVSFDLTQDRRKAMAIDLPDILSPITRIEV